VSGCSFRHEILHYGGGANGFLDGTFPFIRGALAVEEPVFVAVGRERSEPLREALGDDAERVYFADTRQLANPGRIISMWHDLLANSRTSTNGSSPAVLGIGESAWPGRSAAELVECQRQEALLNLAFRRGPAWHLLCPYDMDRLEDHVIEAARSSHAFVAHEGESQPNAAYRCADEPARPFAGDLPRPQAAVRELEFDEQGLGVLRRFVSSWGGEEQLELEATEELVLAVNELATNSIRYGGGQGTLRVWRENRELLCEVSDGGYIEDPLVGRRRPAPDAQSGRGLWLVNNVCDLVQIRSSQAGTVVRVHKRLS